MPRPPLPLPLNVCSVNNGESWATYAADTRAAAAWARELPKTTTQDKDTEQ
jgi:hypothetical protein